MKLNRTAILIGSLIGSATALILFPTAVQAQTASSDVLFSTVNPLPTAFQQLHLNAAQQQQVLQIRQAARDQMQQLLNDSQMQQLKSALKSGKSMREAIATIDMPASTRDQIRSLYRSAYQRIVGMLSGTQKTQLRQQQTQQHANTAPSGQ